MCITGHDFKKLTVECERPYDVFIGNGAVDIAGSLISRITPSKHAAIITDDLVGNLYTEKLADLLKKSGINSCIYSFPHGESSKNLNTVAKIYDFLAQNQITRSDFIIALGGGVTGDMAGFAAATYSRGIDYVQIPTSLLAQVDSSVGGKTAVDIPAGKNLVGAFWQPRLVICDTGLLKTLPDYYIEDGLGECVKYAMIQSPQIFELLKVKTTLQALPFESIVYSCLQLKANLVAEDEHDTGNRMLLNFGHTLGHAIEKYYNFTGISHGRAVAIGMALICGLGEQTGWTDKGTTDQLKNILQNLGLPFDTDIPIKTLLSLCLVDKKRQGNILNLITCEKPGITQIRPVHVDSLNQFI